MLAPARAALRSKAEDEARPRGEDSEIRPHRSGSPQGGAVGRRKSGLLGEKSARIGGRISPALLEQAKKQTGISTDTDLIEFALANVALEDEFSKAFDKVRGTVDPSLKLGF